MERIAVIGAGLSGLAAVKELTEKGHNVVCFEKGNDIGGVFAECGSYDSVYLTVSNYFMAYSDFMPYGDSVRFWSRYEYKEYLDRYAEHFNLRTHIKFGFSLKQMEKSESGGWELTFCTEDDRPFVDIFDRVVVCSGQFQRPNIPKIPGLDSFPGQIIHSASYKNVNEIPEIRGKRVLCFGMGESAADVITEISAVAKRSVLSLRRYHLFSARSPNNRPIDVVQSRYWHTLPAKVKSDEIRRIWQYVLDTTDHEPSRLQAQHMLRAGDEAGSVVTKTERIFEAQAYHNLEVDIGGVSQIDGNRVTFQSGRQEDFDAIVFCTGFEFSLPFLPETYQFKDVRECYLQMFHPELRESVAFIGFVRPQQGGIPLMAELQSRYYAMICSGDRQLPNNLAELAERDANEWRTEFYETPEVFGLVNGLRYNEKLADLIGCRPPVPNFFRSPKQYFHYWFHHIWPSQYRLVGPGAREEARKHWMEAPAHYTRKEQWQVTKGVLKMKVLGMLPRGDRERYKWRPILQK